MVSPLGVGAAWLAPPGAKPPGYEVKVGAQHAAPLAWQKAPPQVVSYSLSELQEIQRLNLWQLLTEGF